ncbi:MAG: dihydrofolate reductase [Paludibacteraceae bacterium]|nr:dihydrofolate reductase [Bacteroidales bacterium]MDY4148531.1 dihydrofolate reductase [Paludibacteraceae bacterium]
MLSIIAAISEDNAIGKGGELLCHLPNDLRHFKQITLGSAVIMGSATYLSLPRRPLPKRQNIVITSRQDAVFEGADVAHSIEEALQMVSEVEEAFVIGGGSIYRQMMPLADKLYITHIHHSWPDADTFFPEIKKEEWLLQTAEEHPADNDNPYIYTFAEYVRVDPIHNA